jgi:hypothetical protein
MDRVRFNLPASLSASDAERERSYPSAGRHSFNGRTSSRFSYGDVRMYDILTTPSRMRFTFPPVGIMHMLRSLSDFRLGAYIEDT